MENNDASAEQDRDDARKELRALQHIYTNGFTVHVANADIVMVLRLNGENHAVVNMSFTLAKTLVEKLGGVMRALEEGAGRIMLTTDDVDVAIKRVNDEKES